MSKSTDQIHLSVLLEETVAMANPSGGGVFIDATLGMGGHTEWLLESGKNVSVIGLDQDAEALRLAGERLARFGERFRSVKRNFADIKDAAKTAGISEVDGIIADLGVSSLQFDSETRGFSFRYDAPLDMRMDADADIPTAAELLETLSEEEIANVIYQYGEERASRRIARWIVERRKSGEPIRTTRELAGLVERALKKGGREKIHPATRTFQALRIAVNSELDVLEKFLTDAFELLKINGRLAVITFHSLEDRIVKQTFQKLSGRCFCPPRMPVCVCGAAKKAVILTRKPILPSEEELKINPRSRSAKLRAVEKIA
jgi:16S rRNA (cytosine1402-N4)-methyltransferase